MMIGIGTLVNAFAVVVGALVGLFFGKFINDKIRATLQRAMAVVVLFVGISMTIEAVFSASVGGKLESHGMLSLVIAIAVGAVLGEVADIESKVDFLGERLRRICSRRLQDNGSFVNGFSTATITFCVGAMAIVGAIDDGVRGNATCLFIKSILDGVFACVLAAAVGKGVIFSALPVLVYQGLFTAIAYFAGRFIPDVALVNISSVGGVLIFCIGYNLLSGKKRIRVMNLLPAEIIAAFLPCF